MLNMSNEPNNILPYTDKLKNGYRNKNNFEMRKGVIKPMIY